MATVIYIKKAATILNIQRWLGRGDVKMHTSRSDNPHTYLTPSPSN